MRLDYNLTGEYVSLFQSMKINESKKAMVAKKVDQFKKIADRYVDITLATGVPWWMICILHHMECGNDFSKHLHNGDPLTDKTKQVPAGRPLEGEPPFTFEESAIDAIEYERLDMVENWNIPTVLYFCEGYNGWGYRRFHPEVKSPYLWSMCNHYTAGKYIGDGKFDPKAVSGQIGIAVLFRMMIDTKLVKL